MRATHQRGDLVLARDRWDAFQPFFIVGAVAIVLGGLVAAVTGPLDLARGSWLAAYLVLAFGVAQLVLGAGQAALTEDPAVPAARLWTELVGWNGGSALVLAGGLTGQVWLVVAGSVLLWAALAVFLMTGRGRGPGWAVVLYRLFVVFEVASVAVGILLSVLRQQ